MEQTPINKPLHQPATASASLSLEDILTKDEARLQTELGLTSLRAVRARISAGAHQGGPRSQELFVNARDMLTMVAGTTESMLSSGVRELDELLGGGFRIGHVTELYGQSGSGKTQLCMTTAARTAMAGHGVVILDACNSFNASRLLHYIQKYGGTDQDLTRVDIGKVFDAMGLLAALESSCSRYSDQSVLTSSSSSSADGGGRHALKVIIVDSILPLLAPFTGGGSATSRPFATNLLIHVARALRTCAQTHGVAVIVTNGIVEGSRPALGMHWTFVPTTSLLVESLVIMPRRRGGQGSTATMASSSTSSSSRHNIAATPSSNTSRSSTPRPPTMMTTMDVIDDDGGGENAPAALHGEKRCLQGRISVRVGRKPSSLAGAVGDHGKRDDVIVYTIHE